MRRRPFRQTLRNLLVRRDVRLGWRGRSISAYRAGLRHYWRLR